MKMDEIMHVLPPTKTALVLFKTRNHENKHIRAAAFNIHKYIYDFLYRFPKYCLPLSLSFSCHTYNQRIIPPIPTLIPIPIPILIPFFISDRWRD